MRPYQTSVRQVVPPNSSESQGKIGDPPHSHIILFECIKHTFMLYYVILYYIILYYIILYYTILYYYIITHNTLLLLLLLLLLYHYYYHHYYYSYYYYYVQHKVCVINYMHCVGECRGPPHIYIYIYIYIDIDI